jgi:hypothetical protein
MRKTSHMTAMHCKAMKKSNFGCPAEIFFHFGSDEDN